ncbi:FxLYD domain-containing protein [Enterococcus sp. AZ109]|uniref:FxLYD domain-containing protein n=1 Tax=Enterococcus sp. AZ109 TaxID=2774634 RepID=UPI003F239C7D
MSYRNYTAVVENTTGLNLSSLSAKINLVDAEGVVVDTSYLNANNWKAGQKYKFEFMTDKEFQSIEVELSYDETEN